MTRARGSRKLYPKHKDDAFDRWLTEQSKGPDGQFSMDRFCDLFARMGKSFFIPVDGNNGTKRMTAGILLRQECPDGVIHFLDGTQVILDLEE